VIVLQNKRTVYGELDWLQTPQAVISLV